jgi:hypothetical protein
MSLKDKYSAIIERSKNRQYFYEKILKLFAVVETLGLRMIVENPHSQIHYLQLPENFVAKPTIIDKNRQTRGDYFVKPTAYWFVGCEPTNGFSPTKPKRTMRVNYAKSGIRAGICSEERSLISPDYARNFICDFILGRVQKNSVVQYKLNF